MVEGVMNQWVDPIYGLFNGCSFSNLIVQLLTMSRILAVWDGFLPYVAIVVFWAKVSS